MYFFNTVNKINSFLLRKIFNEFVYVENKSVVIVLIIE
jgi:hypothetical protein